MIRRGILAPWAEAMRGFAKHRDHAWCKLSGLVTEADWRSWRADDLRPYVEEALAIFGSGRCVYGSDWPVCTLAGDYAEVIGALRECIGALSADERACILGRNAVELYRLDATPRWPSD
jgi:L-fuconolactonase